MIKTENEDKVDVNEKEWLRVASDNAAFDFLKEPEEDLYTHSDGKPFHVENLFMNRGKAIL